MKKTWPCNHIEHDRINPFLWSIVFQGKESQVPDSWATCPIKGCGAKRPKTKREKKGRK